MSEDCFLLEKNKHTFMNDLQTFQTMIRFQNHEITRLKRKGERSSNHTKKNHKMQKSIQKKNTYRR